MTPLRARQERFCRRFVEYGSATTTAVAAGYAPRSAKNAGYRLRREMMTFAEGKKLVLSTLYAESMMTFVYRPKNRFRVKSMA